MGKKIGVIGGMGPMASQLFYRMVTERTCAQRDQEHVEMVILSDTLMPDRTQAICNHRYEEVTERLCRDAIMLQECGCQGIAIACNTAHFFADMIAGQIRVPIIHMIRETAEALAGSCRDKRVMIFSTDGTIKTGLYQRALEEQGIDSCTLSAPNQKNLMHEIYDRIKSGKPYDAAAWREIEAELEQRQCEKVLLACTELSVIKTENELDDKYVDPLEILADRVIEFSGHQVKSKKA